MKWIFAVSWKVSLECYGFLFCYTRVNETETYCLTQNLNGYEYPCQQQFDPTNSSTEEKLPTHLTFSKYDAILQKCLPNVLIPLFLLLPYGAAVCKYETAARTCLEYAASLRAVWDQSLGQCVSVDLVGKKEK